MGAGLSTRRLLAAGAGVTAALAADVLALQAFAAFRREYLPAESAPSIDGDYGDPSDPTVRLVVLGDSTGAGVGVTETDESVGGRLAALLAAGHLHIQLSGVAVFGSRAGDLGPQVSRALLNRPDIAVVLVGANDATHGTSARRIRPALIGAIRRLRAAGVPVVLGTCPDLGAAQSVARPLRDVLAAYGRRVAQTQADAGTRAGALVVDLAARTGPAFRANPAGTLAADEFHPSAGGYELWAQALLPAVRDAVGIRLPQT
ncbi:MAG TPA: SGNH/GDSL hydrolase family protein [Mycobacteriales bacterium]|nr:SGNH/GDSL hydrolase family protein [Mycobacteriales bacterium]